ncbi:hypothetical protein CFE70_010551 [Pyrenophora teres f. teres 0-1]
MKKKTMNPPRKNELEPQEMGQIWAWNHKIPGVTNKCIHDLFAEQVLAQPNAPAICAWDGEMSYSVLDGLSTKLAGYLVKIGVKPGDVVPLCFEKSMWTVVAMLAVLKAGGAFAPLDPDHPVSRHKEILRQTGARMVVVSAQHSARWASSSCHVVTLSEASIGQLTVEDDLPGFSATPGNAAYVLFTSGSTGIPKGVVLEHRAVSTSCLGHGRAFGITDQSRVLQFTSYTFDFCMAEIITTLLYGGCICVPSDRDRHSDLAKAINTMGANWALLTPSVAQLLNPSDVPTLKILVIGGEQVTSTDWNRWPTSVQLINGYGPTECCIVCTGYTTTQAFKTGTIGTAIASVSWVVDPEDYHKLAPLGSVGELLVEGPILARGYLNDAEKTAAAFIEDPAWLVDGCQGYAGRRGRLYKTGDLVRYDDEGNLVCLGRKDSQVKVRGQRVELGEIEHHIQGCMPEANQIAVEVILLEGEKSNTILAAFLQLDVKTGRAFPTNKAAETGSLAQVIFPVEAGKKLAERLPSYMVPDVYFVVTQLPITVSGKTDRKRLREIGASFSAQQLAEIRTSGQGLKRQPSTENEKALQQLWAGVLAIDADSIGLDDSFFRLGGDSIAAMKLVGEARRAGIHLTVADLFRNPKLEAVASLNLSLGNSSPENIVAFALLGETSDVTQIREEVAASCNTNTSLIEDIYPCSPLQEGMMALASKRPGDYIMQSVLALHDDTDEDRFRAAWERVVQSTAVLRTRIVHSSKMGMLQVVLADGIEWEQANELEQYLEKDKSVSMGLGDSLARYALVRDVGTGKRWMVWTLHHALYDGWSLPQIANLVTEVYHGAEVGKQPGFNAFIKYLGEQDHEAAAAYWQGTLADCQAISFPALPPAVQQPVADATTAFQCPALARRPSDITMSTLIRAAWALLASSYTSSDDVVFGATVTGRNAPVAGIEAMAGPTIATVPVRVRVQHSHKVSEFLHSVQQQATEMIPYEQTGLHETAKVSADARHACSFQTLLIVQPGSNGDIAHDALGEWRSHSDLQDFTTYALMVQCVLADDEVQIIASFDRRAIEPWQVDKMLRQFSFVMQQLATADAEAGIASIDTLTPEDRQQLWEWNHDVPPAIERCIHDLFADQAKARPDAPAICAWDGDMTYGELDVLSGRLAGHLVELGVGPEDIVPLCFEKSMWTVVAMLAVLKAGGAFLLLDPSLPHERLRLMCRKVSAKLSLASEASAPLAKDLVGTVVIVNADSALQLAHHASPITSVRPTHTAYVIFTSGSTGEPKGCRIEHRAASSAVTAHGRYLGMQASTRTLQFASYAFAGSLVELLMNLCHGGCICVLSEEERRTDLASAMCRMKVNWAFLTSTVVDLLTPKSVPSLSILCVGGEPIRASQIVRWGSQVHLRQTYGSSEVSGIVSSAALTTCSTMRDVGRASTGVFWIVDPNNHNRLAPVGAVGEVLVEGPVLGREYIDEPDKTASTFIEAPAWRASLGLSAGQQRLYKTGDLARYKDDGSIELIGRKDNQVKLRGQRIEVEEIEHQARLAEADVAEIAVELIQPKDGEDGMLACFIVVEDSASNEDELSGKRTRLDTRTQRTIGKIQDRLERFLPQYMVPAVFIPILTLPVTWSKKIDRKRLREVGSTFSGRELAELQATTQGLKRQPSTENEKALQQLWAGVLAIDADSIGLDDSFFRLGGDSIAAMKLVGEARRAGIHLTVADLFRNPKLDQLTAAAIASAHASPASIPQVEHAGPVAQSFAQGRLWFLEELHPGLTWYLMPLAVRIRGPLDLVALHSALLAVERRHETLRTTFATVDGASVQVVQPFQAKDLNIIDIVPGDEQGLTEAVHQDHSTPFDLRTEPGWRVTVYRMSNDDHVLSTVMHHIISDGWSVDVLMRELAAFYSASMRGQDPLSQVQPLSVQYRDFSAWQREQAQADEHQKQLSYWVEQLQSSRPAELLCDKPRPAALSGEAGVQSIEIAGPLYAKLQSFCQLHGVTQFVVLLAAFRATHFRLTGQEDATIGTPNANRDRWEVKDMVGFFVNMQCLRIKIGDESFEELVQQVHEVAVASHANADVPFENIVSKLKNDRDLSRHPLVQLVFAVHAQRDLGQLKLEGVETENLGDTVTSRFDLEFHFSQQADGLWGSVMFSTDLYAPETIDNMLSVFRRVLETCLEQPQAAVASMPLLRDADYAKLDAMGLVRVEKTAYPRDSSVVDLFREQAAACPSRVAVKDSVAEMTYAQLDAASDVLARWLARRSLAPETLVGVFASRSCEAIVAFLGILKANLAYLPFDVKTPATRMEDILSSRPGHRLILVGAGAQLPSTKLSNIEFVSITEALDEQSAEKPGLQMPTTLHGPSATSLAYVMFTSGSTGQPKGVMVEHRGIVRLVRDNNLVQHLPSSPVMAHMANLAFDASTWEIYGTLLCGGTLVCIDAAMVLDAEAVLQTFRKHCIRTAYMAPSLFRSYILQSPALFTGLDMLCVGGEAVHLADLRAAEQYLTGKFVNGYGPTENTTFSTTFLVSKNEQYTNGVPIGRALSNSGAYVMDSGLRLVPLGVVGELVVTGDGLARGYTDPARNVDRFVSVEIGGKTVRAYRTGDYVRHRPTDGQLEFFGRMDGQVKIRGNRVELGEIEHTLRSDKVVREAVAVLQQHDGSEARLAGFVTVHEDAETADEHVDDSNESQHVDVWEEKFDADIYSPIDSVQAENIGRDFVGWTSMYDGSDIDKAEMNEWLDDTIATMLNGQRPGNVLEIGSGTGMILFNLGDGLQSYVGLDPSRKAVQFIAETAKSIPGLASKIRMYKATAADVGRLEQPVAASLVVVNSVVQYFPSLDYLFKMVQQLVELEGTRTLFFGDVRSCALHREFLATRAVHMAGDKATKADIRRMVADMERVERELLVDPAFFTALPSRLPGLVEHVEILPKKMKATNELSCYRYAAVVHVRPRDGQTQELAIRDVAHDRWIDFAERRLDRQSLLQQLKSLSSAPAVAVSNIPYSKTIVSRCLVHSLDGTEAETPDSPDWLASVHQRAQDCPSLSATELVELAQEVDCRVEISWSRQHSQQGGLDAIFHRYQPLTGERVMFRFPTDHAERPLHSLSSRPLRQQFLQKTQQRLLEMLEAQLPTYMVPQTLAILDAMPVNQNGKVDRKALEQQIDTQKGQSGLKRQPETETQRTMQQLWAGVLAIDADSIGLDDSFFRLGGDSIAAMKLVGEARRAGIHLTVADLFRNPKLDQLTAAAIASAHASPASIPQVEHAGPVAQSFAQGRLWFLEELHPGLTWYLMPLAVRIRGPLDLVALHSALLAVERRHETLRTTFATVDGASVQVVQPFQAKDLNIIDIVPGDEQGLTEAVHQDHSTPFDLRTEPGWRVTVYRMSNDDHVLSTVMHHIISDGWSVDVLMRELAAFYSASMRGQDPLSQVQPLSVQYRDFSAWQREQAQADEHQKQLSYWVEQLQSSRPAELLCDKPRPAALSGEAGVQSIEIAGPLYAKLQSFCQLHGVTQFVVLLAAFRATHFRLTGQEDATIGTPNANRDRWEVKDMVGFFVNMQCLRIKIGDESFEELVQQVHEVAVASHANADVPFENIVSKLKNDRDLSRHPLVQLVFAVHAQRDLGQLKLEGVETENLGDTVTSRFDLEFHFSQQADGLWGSVMFSTDLYAPETIDNMLSVFRRVLETCLEQPQAAVASMPLLRDADYAKLDAMGLVRVEKTAYPRDSSVVDLFREQAAACPSRVAVKDSVAEMTYAQLDAASDVLARWLARRSLAPETLVGVFASRSCEAIVAFLGILKANLAYLPFDVKTPATRMEDILSSRPGHRLILVGAGAQLPSTKLSNIEFVSITEALDEQSAEKPGLQMPTTLHGPSATSLAYVMFTSGSTGQPKGVMVEHRGIVRLVRDNNLVQHLPSSPVMAHIANLAFDASMWEIYNSLLNCGTLICVDAATVLDAQAVLQTFRQHNITTAFFTPSLLRTYVRQSPRLFCRLDMLCVGGEVLHPSDMLAAREHLAGQLINGYGPTENSATSTLYVTCDNDNSTNGVPIGRALSNSGAYVMDSGLRLVPLGVVGELVVTGDGLARGYTDPARNVDRFVSVEIGGKTVRAYRTGDYVRHRPTDGQLEFFGRMDGQVKIRGNRVELGEIEHALRSDKSVREAVTVLQQPDGSEARLAGFVTLHECTAMAEEKADHTDGAPHADARKQRFLQNTQRRLVEMLEAQLPTYMVPQTLAILDAMPVNQNGKVDRKALEQQIDTQKGQSGLKRQPETETQRTMQQLWAGVLAIDADSIGLDDSFFRLGGDSIAAMKLVGEARRAGIHLTVADLFRNPKLDQLTAAAIASAHASPASIPQVEHAGPVAQSFAQGRLWFLEELHPGLTWYLMPLAVRIRGPLDLVALHSALLAVERRHETLRTTFATVDGASVQVVQPFQAKDLNIIDIVPGDEQGLTEAVHQDHSTPFDLRTEPGWRVTVYRMSNDDHVLSTVMHHIISDGWSVDVLMRELAAFYSASMRGQDPLSQVQPLSVQYRDFSAWQREQAQADEHQKQLSYWVEQLQSSRPAELLCDKPRPAALSGEAGVQSIEIAGPLYAKLQSFCQLHGVTQFVVLLAAFRATHFRLTGQEDATIGTPNANRDRWEVKDMVGFFVNMQCLRIKIGDESFEELVQQVHEVAVASHANADVPFENIVSKLKNDRDLSRHPLVQLVFAVHAQRDLGQLKLEGVETENLGDTVTSRFDLEFHFSQQADGLWGSVMFSTDLYAPETIDNMLSVFRRVLETCLEQPQAAVASMPLLRDADYAKLDAMGLVRVEKTAYPRDSSVVDLFREQAAACPSRVAVKDSVAEMTYAQLDAASDVLARWLARRSLAPETLVGVFASRSCEAIVAFLGILKANLAYLPFDVKTPATRMEDILSSRPGHRLILVGAGAQLPSTKLSNIEFVSITEALDEQSAEKPGLQMPTTLHGPSATSLAYVMFTSGSTGQPKGVMVEHRGIVRLVRDNNLVQHLPSSPVMAHMANLAFDASTWEIYGTLLCGGTLVCIDAAMVLDAEAVLQTFRKHCIRTAYMAPSLFRSYILQSPALFTGLDMLCVGGEAVHLADLRAAEQYLTGKFVNGYGPTENTTFSTTFLVSKNEQYTNGVPIGRALSNSGAYVMDSGLRLVPLGVVGELVVTGDGLARGYTDPARNVDRFVSVEIGGKTVRAYRTGDYVRHRPTDGQLEFFGRMDGQVKIRGNRVELGEIEHALRSDKSVREAVTVLQQPDGSEARLAGFVTLHECTAMAEEKADHTDGAPHADARKQRFLQNTQRRLVEMLEAQLPTYMVPQTLAILDAMPVNQNGKVDRKALEQQIDTQKGQSGLKRQPETETQRTMQQLWAGVLAIDADSIGLDDSFFRLGGDSIAAMKLVGEARRAGIHLTVADLFRNPKLEAVASLNLSLGNSSPENIVAFALLGETSDVTQIREEVAASCNTNTSLIEDIYPCSPLQEGMMALTSKRPGDYIMQSVLALHDDTDEDRFRAAWERVVQSTAVLRTRIVHSSKMGMLQVVLADGIEWEQANELEQYLEKDKSVSMGLGDSLARYALVRDVGTGKRWMVWTLHHALYDGWSLPQIANLVTEVYHGAEVGKQPGFNAFIKYLGEQDHEAAAAYWQGTLADCQAISFPALPPAVQQPVADATTAFQCPALARRPSDITMSTLIRAAWALLASSYTSSDDVVFGATVTGRNAPVAGIEAMAGPTIATVPVRVRVQHSHKVSEFLHSVQQQATEMIPYEQTGLHETAKVSADARHACSFQTLLIVQPGSNGDIAHDALGEWRSHSDLQDFTTYALMVQCVLADDEVQIIASFDRRAIEPWQVDKMLRQFSFVMQQLATADAEAGIASIDTLTPEDRQQLWEWNHDVPPAIERCIHDLFADQAKARPDAPAICAWDGDMTYGELDVLSGRLAGHLVELGVGPEDIVPLCFEKSMWTVVAMLAVLKAGGAFLLLDPSLPHERLRLMCRKVSAKLSLASEASAPLAKDLVGTVVIVNADSALQLAHHASPITSVRPTHTAYVIFTSGSTGEPKGCRIEHRAASSAVTAHGRYLGMQASTRTLQFASYAFAGSLVELLMNLCHGGCICVLSEEERRTDLASAMCRMKVNWAFLTSTVVDLLTPKSVPSLSILCVGGEPIRASQIVRWGSQVHLRQTYGSSEVSGIVSSAALTTCSTTRDVGRASTGVFWIVDPNNHNRLAPVGAVGEVLVEGPVLGREYIDEPDKTASTFIEAPAWRASLGLSAGQQRLYKTGDLARYKDDGSIELIGRKDNQVKLRGQRIEVEEIEHQARLAEADVAEIAVELIQPKDGEDGMLACFIVVEDSASNEDELSGKRTRLDTRTQRTIGKIQDRLERFLPQYMVPAVFIPILTLPVTWSKKIDRKRLREVGSTFSGRELAELQATTQGLKRQPSTENEKALQQLWAGVLAIDADSIGLDDSFFRLGGDSIAAMKLVGEARRAGIHLTVADLFRNPKLECLSRIGRKLLHRIVEPVLSFSLLPPAIKEDILSNQKSLGKINDLASIVDILPVTHCQKFFLSRGQHDPRIAFNYFYVEMGPQLDLYLLRNSCRKVLDHLSILRSRFVPLDDQWFQIILHDLDLPFSVHDVNESLDEASHAICMQDIERTDPLEVPTSFKVVRYKSTHNRLIIRLSHAQYDGVSFPIILRTLISTYQQEPLHPVAEFSTFLAHARKIQTLSGRYWRELLQGSRPIRVTEKLRLQVQEDISPRLVSVEKYMDAPRLPEGITMASLISSAWALVLAHITGEQDIVFGHLVAGRNSDIPEVAEIVGPCLNVIPVRTLVYPIKTSKDLIQSVQDQHVSLGESDSMGWDEIVKDCTDWPAGTMYDSLVQHQNIIARPEISFAGVTAKLNWFQNPFGEAPFLFLFSEPEDSQLKIMISGNTHFLTVERASLLVDMLAQTAQALSYSPQASLASHRLSLPGCAFNDG